VSYKDRDEVSNLRNRSFWLEKKSKLAVVVVVRNFSNVKNIAISLILICILNLH